jgi:hypothetical protein
MVVALAIAGAGALAMALPAATSADQGIVVFTTTGKIKVAKRVQYSIACSVQCDVIIRQTLKLQGPDLAPVTVPGTLAPNIPASPFIVLNKPALQALRRDVAKARLVSAVTATSSATGAKQRIRAVFSFKRARRPAKPT